MTSIEGESEQGAKRVLEVSHEGDRVHLWIHSPGNRGNGWSIYVSAAELCDALQSACRKLPDSSTKD